MRFEIMLENKFFELHSGSSDDKLSLLKIITSPGYSVALNAEKLIACHKDSGLKAALCKAHLRVVDGASVTALLRHQHSIKPKKLDLPKFLLALADQKSLKIDVIGATKEINDRACSNIRKTYPNIKVNKSSHGYRDDEILSQMIKGSDSDLIFLGLGSPRQELLACRVSPHSRGFIVCCGGALKVISGDVSDAPEVVKNSYFEWLFRLILEPAKFLRVVRMLIQLNKVFSYKTRIRRC